MVTDVKNGGSFNRYVYGNNNTYKFANPDGRAPDNIFEQQGLNLGPLKKMWHGVFGPDKALASLNIDFKLEAGAALGAGIEIEQSLFAGAGAISFVPVGEGTSIGLFAQTKEGCEAKFAKGDSPVTFKSGGEIKGGLGIVGAVEVEASPGGKLSAIPKAGIGAGEMVKYGPSMKVFEWGKKEN